jgi:hypothetical protein
VGHHWDTLRIDCYADSEIDTSILLSSDYLLGHWDTPTKRT